MDSLSLYIHIPFCEKRCNYCDFTSFTSMESSWEEYRDHLIREIELYRELLGRREIRTIFFGGGTPSLVPGQHIYSILEAIASNFSVARDAEITIEANPGSLDLEKLSIYKEGKINRISLGAQSFNNDLLGLIGRNHREEDIYRSIGMIRKSSIDNINLDLISGLPNQSLDLALDSIDKAIDLGVEHISNYSLIIEPGTQLYSDLEKGRIQVADDDLDRKIYHRIRERLIGQGYQHYEISNYAKEGYESRHNLVYWNIEEYLGLGLSSHSNIGGERFANTNKYHDYIRSIKAGTRPLVLRETIDRQEEISEYLIMGIRKIGGIDKEAFRERFQEDLYDLRGEALRKNIESQLLVDRGGRISLSRRGLDLCNQVELDLY